MLAMGTCVSAFSANETPRDGTTIATPQIGERDRANTAADSDACPSGRSTRPAAPDGVGSGDGVRDGSGASVGRAVAAAV